MFKEEEEGVLVVVDVVVVRRVVCCGCTVNADPLIMGRMKSSRRRDRLFMMTNYMTWLATKMSEREYCQISKGTALFLC